MRADPAKSGLTLGRAHDEVPSERDRSRRPLYSAGTSTCFLVANGVCTETEDGELLKYDAERVRSWAFLARVRGTVLASWHLWLHVGLCVALAIAVLIAVSLLAKRPELIDQTKMCEAVKYFSVFVAVALAFHVSVAVDRWWEMRSQMLGGLWCAIDDLNMILAAHFPSREHRNLKTLVLRYCLLSMELTFMQARGRDGDLSALCSRHLLREDERLKLEKLSSKPQVVWVWIAGTFQRLADAGKLQPRLLVTLYDICSRGRSSIGGVFTFMDTQLPFSYVHLISVIVHINNFLVAVKCGTLSAVALRNLWRHETEAKPISDSENVQMLLMQALAAVAIPLVNLGLLEVAVLVSDPFSSKQGPGFPSSVFHMWMRDECEAFQTTAEEAPAEIARIADKVEIEDWSFADDCAVAV